MMLSVFIAGAHVGTVEVNRAGEATFTYVPSYEGPDLSASMPFTTQPYPDETVRPWFAGLLPDDERVRRGMAANGGGIGASSVSGVGNVGSSIGVDTFSLLERYGMDSPGAVQVVSEHDVALIGRPGTYEQVEEAVIGARLERLLESEREGGEFSWLEPGERWSLGGQQSKLALCEFGGAWYECRGSAASNVIVKPGVGRFMHQALNECICINLANLCGLPAAKTRMHVFLDTDAVVVDRFDRVGSIDAGITRLHQEDLCQALSLAPDKKYATDGGPTSSDAIALLRNAREGSVDRFVDALLFSALIASTDGHAKNYSLIHVGRGDFTLAPLYDIASAAPYFKPHKAYRLAMSIGGENRVGYFRKSRVMRFANLNGFDGQHVLDRSLELSALIRANLEKAVDVCSHVEGCDEFASVFVPRIRRLCEAAERNLTVADGNAVPVDVALP